jgi:hypothetical protein
LSDTLTESFCERCGTRYEFRAPTRLNPLRKTRGFIGGVKNYLTSQDAMSDAMRDAMRQEEEALSAAQLDVFHASFNFCIDCRQYTCVNCWNDDAGRCRTCSPIPGTDDLAERLAASMDGSGAVAVTEPVLADDEAQRSPGLTGWPDSDLPSTPVGGRRPDVAWPETDVVSGAAPPVAEHVPAAAEVEPEPIAAEADVEIQPEPVADEVEVEQRPALRVVAWETDAPYDVFEPEPVAAEVEPEPVAAEVEPEPVAAEVEPEPVAPIAPIAPISETILHFPDRERPQEAEPAVHAAEQESPEVAARRAQLDLLGLGDPGEGPVQETRPGVLPYRSRGATPSPSGLAARTRAGGSGFWEASAREVAGASAAIGIQNCGECGLSLSATARFCRRCGTRQARSA